MKVLNLITISLFCMSFLVHCFFALMLMLLVDNIRVEEKVYHTWMSESGVGGMSARELNLRLERIVSEIHESFWLKGYSDVSVMHEFVCEDSANFFGINFYVSYEIQLGKMLTSGVSKEAKNLVADIVRSEMATSIGTNDDIEECVLSERNTEIHERN